MIIIITKTVSNEEKWLKLKNGSIKRKTVSHIFEVEEQTTRNNAAKVRIDKIKKITQRNYFSVQQIWRVGTKGI